MTKKGKAKPSVEYGVCPNCGQNLGLWEIDHCVCTLCDAEWEADCPDCVALGGTELSEKGKARLKDVTAMGEKSQAIITNTYWGKGAAMRLWGVETIEIHNCILECTPDIDTDGRVIISDCVFLGPHNGKPRPEVEKP